MLAVIVVAALLVAITSLIHYEALSILSRRLPRTEMPRRALVLVALMGLFVAHAIEIVLYAVGYTLLARWPDLGGIGLGPTDFETALYFSAETYTSLGLGDVTPVGPMRLLAGVEALNGLLLIAWSASFMYLEMERHWRPR